MRVQCILEQFNTNATCIRTWRKSKTAHSVMTSSGVKTTSTRTWHEVTGTAETSHSHDYPVTLSPTVGPLRGLGARFGLQHFTMLVCKWECIKMNSVRAAAWSWRCFTGSAANWSPQDLLHVLLSNATTQKMVRMYQDLRQKGMLSNEKHIQYFKLCSNIKSEEMQGGKYARCQTQSQLDIFSQQSV